MILNKRKYGLVGEKNINKKKNIKKKNEKNEEIEIEDEELVETEIPIFPMIPPKSEEYIYRLDNHIYFTTDVTMLNINKLSKLIYQINREFEITKASIKYGDLQPTPIYLYITSLGGDIFAGLRGMDIIENSNLPIYTIVEGYAQSAGSILFLAGKKRYMTANSYMLIHQLSSYGENGTYEQLKDSFANNQVLMDRIIEIYNKKSNGKLTKKKLQEVLKRDLYWNFETCKSYNLADEIYTGKNV